jgi:ABC-type bacteriocin/lantibiotic exporter with double-glycine peptidase domain
VIANALLIAIAVMLAIGFTLMGELKFFIPLKVIVWRAFSTYILLYVGTVFLNIFAAAYALNRKFLLKDTGRKLSHLDKQFNVGHVEFPTPKDDLEPPNDVPVP